MTIVSVQTRKFRWSCPFIACIIVVLVTAAAEEGQSEYPAQVKTDLEAKVGQMRSRWDKATDDVFGLVDQMVSRQLSNLGLAAKELLVGRARQMSVLQKGSLRLQVATRHGVFGKCCCSQDASGECRWRGAGAGIGTQLLMCPDAEMDYYEHKGGRGKETADAQTTDMLLDACVQSVEWQRHTKRASDAATSATPMVPPAASAEALQTLRDFQDVLQGGAAEATSVPTVADNSSSDEE